MGVNINLLLEILLPIFIFSFFGLYILIQILYRRNHEFHHKGIKIFKLDLYSRKIMSSEVTRKQDSIFKKFNKHEWKRLKVFISQFYNSVEITKMFRDALMEINNNKVQEYSFEFESGVSSAGRKAIYSFVVLLSSIESDSDYIMTISWEKQKDSKINDDSKIEFINKSYVTKMNYLYKGFVAFNVNNKIEESATKLIKIMQRISKKKLTYFKNNDVLIVVFYGSNIKQVNKHMVSFINKIKNKGKTNGTNMFFDGSGYIALEKINNPQALNRALRVLDFFIILSIDLKRDFISRQNKEYDKEEYKKYSDAVKIFRSSIKNEEIDTLFSSVRRVTTNREIINYAYPTIKNLSENTLNALLTNRNNKIELFNSHAKLIGINSIMTKHVLVDVDAKWLIKKQDELKYKKAIYVIGLNLDIKYSELKEAMQNLQKNNFVFAIRVIKFTESIKILIKQINPKFILVDKLAWGHEGASNPNVFMMLLTIKKVVEIQGIKVIYENPPTLVGEKTAENIGVHFYYNI